MTVTADEMYSQVVGAKEALGKLSAKERQTHPSKHFGENYNRLLELSKEAMPNVDSRRWPQPVPFSAPHMGASCAVAGYADIDSYFGEILAILIEGSSAPAAGIMG